MNIGTMCVFKNCDYYGGDVVIATTDTSPYINVDVIVVPKDVKEHPSGGGMYWSLSIPREGMNDNKDVYEALKTDEFTNYGSSEVIDIIEEETK